MEMRDQVVVVTGGASGIGKALALQCAAEGAAGILIADLDAEGADAVAREIGPAAVGVLCDVADPDHAHKLIAAAAEAFGGRPVDVFFANAGIAVGDGLGDPGEWALAVDVNVAAHVVAARALLPGWLERGRGTFVCTASAAGLLSQIGSAPYAVTKHAAVAFSEWLSITYGGQGVQVACLCPMGVATPLLETAGTAGRVVRASGPVLAPAEVAEVVMGTLRTGEFLILPHPEVLDYLRHKGTDYDRWIGGMRRLQAAILSEAP
ncbi:MAG: putative oxidoreductase [Solirubrobacterales bacterium]|jgi:NAD(P)-dependent dehydrogenase (short-subunit alcohol dehydrogenase family)|nr:putative oxidoreductase [Solirubrobacterales bacterium]